MWGFFYVPQWRPWNLTNNTVPLKLALYVGIRRLFTIAPGKKSFWQREELPDVQQHIMLGQLGLLPPQAMCPTLLMDVAIPKTRTSDLPLNQPCTTLLHVLLGSDIISSQHKTSPWEGLPSLLLLMKTTLCRTTPLDCIALLPVPSVKHQISITCWASTVLPWCPFLALLLQPLLCLDKAPFPILFIHHKEQHQHQILK